MAVDASQEKDCKCLGSGIGVIHSIEAMIR